MSHEACEDRDGGREDRVRWLGLAMVAVSCWRGWPDLLRLIEVVRWERGNLGSVLWIDHLTGLWSAWPLALGLALATGRNPRLLRAATISCFSLAIERLFLLGGGFALDSHHGWTSGPEGAGSFPNVLARGFELAGWVGQAFAWMLLAVWSRRMERRWRRATATLASRERAIRGAVGRLSALVSLLFALAIVGDRGWMLFLDVLQRYPSIRQIVLKSGSRRLQRSLTPAEMVENKQFRAAMDSLRDGYQHQAEEQFLEAWASYAKGLSLLEKLASEHSKNRIYLAEVAQGSNNLAWFLVTWPDAARHRPEAALDLARRAVAIEPKDGNAWNTLGVVLYRANDLDGANAAFDQSAQFRHGGDGFDWYFRAMIEARQDRADAARDYYEKAVAWSEKNRPDDGELIRFRAEAAHMLGIAVPPRAETKAGSGQAEAKSPSANSSGSPRKSFGPAGARRRPR